ncbi:DUF6545 domain-containing protein [Nocardia arthritidis]|uniref:DUF6545 domain-containing protein n=1 Tax=Nocardia arthritidis TaxID=228602 RepID=A0A6G9YGT1_9NOCA|nr:DUF6545 domain-containing protein [Nocardia arthritidis]QIS12394.1 hypothetical protein F5544_22665 [Nocardia arthritidis]
MWPHDHLSTWVTMPATVFIVAITIIRFALIRRTSLFGRLINAMMGFDSVAALLREPVIARRVAGVVPGGLPTVFDTWHWLTVMAWACGLGMVQLYHYGPVRYRIRFKVVLGLAAALSAVFLVLSDPARAARMSSIAEYGGWRYGVYVGLCSAPPVIVALYYYVLTRRGTVGRTTTLWERIVLTSQLSFAVASFLPILSIVVFAASDAAGVGNAFTHHMYDVMTDGITSGEPGLLFFAAAVVALIPSAAQAVMQLLRLDRDSRTVRRLYPVWRDLTAAAPQVVFRLKWVDNWNAAPQERLHRRRMEIHDAAEIVARYVVPFRISSTHRSTPPSTKTTKSTCG